MNLSRLLQDTVCGALAAGGFGVLFNVGFGALPLCAASGALALAVRSLSLGYGWRIEAASFLAALIVGFAVQLLPSQTTISRDALHVLGCIPMVPGAFAAKATLGFFALTAQETAAQNELTAAIQNGLRVIFIMIALGAGLAIPTLLLRRRVMK